MANLRVDKITSTETFETTGSVQFDGTTGQLTVSGSDSATTYDFGTDDFTIEFWRYKSSSAVESYVARLDAAGGSATSDFWFGNVNGVDGFYYYEGTTGRNLSTESQPLNTWAHLAVVRYNDYLTLYLNGKEVTSRPHSAAFNNGSANLRIGGDGASSGNTNYPLEGFLSNVRITKKALYTSNFKPSMRELEVTAETVLLACQSKTDATLEKTGKTLVVGGTPVASELTPGLLTPIVKSGGGSAITGSVEFTGSPSKLTADSVDFAMGSNDLTMECWFYNGVDTITHLLQIDTGTYQSPSDITNFSLATRDAAAGDIRFLIRNDSGSNLSDLVAGAPRAKINAWHHLAGTIEGTTTRLFLNGILIASGTISGTRTHTGQRCTIGANQTSRYLKGYLSNVRIVKGTALYTADFIPPTRELKNVPGTVLLCCQDPDNSLTEATGKTITGYGSLQRTDGPELVTNGYFNNGTTGWSVTGGAIAVTSGQLQLTNSNTTLGKVDQTITTVVGQTYQVSALVTPDGGGHFPRLYVGADNDYTPVVSSANIQQLVTVIYTAVSTSTVISLNSNTNNANAVTLLDDVSAYDISYDADAPASNFTPQVGDDRKVTFEGVTKIDTDAYFYLPTGDTITRDSRSGRGLIRMGPGMSYITISSLGNSKDFGDNTVDALNTSACASSTRGLFAQGYKHPLYYKTIDYVTIASTGDAKDFGDITTSASFVYGMGGCASSTRGLFAGGFTAPSPNAAAGLKQINYVTIASLGDSQDFGDLTGNGVRYPAATSSPTRGIFGGGRDSADSPVYNQNVIHYVTIATLGNANNFGDLTDSLYSMAATGSATRGIFAGGYNPAGNSINVMDYITISSTGNAQDFGDLYLTRGGSGASSNATRATFAGGANPSAQNVIDYVTIQSTGNALDFGDLLTTMYAGSGCSDSHGGLG